MTESNEPFVLHPSILVSATLTDLPNSPRANRLLGEVTTGRRPAYAVGGIELLEIFSAEALLAAGSLTGLETEDQADILRELRQQLRELNLTGQLRTQQYETYLLTGISLGARFGIDLYSAMTAAAAGINGRLLILDNTDLYNRLRPAAVRPGLQIMRLSDYP